MTGWRTSKLLSFVSLIFLISLLLLYGFRVTSLDSGLRAQDSGLKTQDSKRDVLLEALNKSKRGLSDIELKGEEYYKHYCSICHGDEGRGDGFNAYNLNPRPKNFEEIIPSMDDQHLYKVISEGTVRLRRMGKSALCPPRGLYLERDTIEAIVAYLRKLTEHRKAYFFEKK